MHLHIFLDLACKMTQKLQLKNFIIFGYLKLYTFQIFTQILYGCDTIALQVLCRRWDRRPFGHNRHGLKRGGLLCPFRGGGAGSPSNTICLGKTLPPVPWYQLASWFIQPFGHNRHMPKSEGAAPLFRGDGFSSSTMSPWPRPTSAPSGILIHRAI